MAVNIRRTDGDVGGIGIGYFINDENYDITLLGEFIFELDSNRDLQPTIDGTEDSFFEINIDNEIIPQE